MPSLHHVQVIECMTMPMLNSKELEMWKIELLLSMVNEYTVTLL